MISLKNNRIRIISDYSFKGPKLSLNEYNTQTKVDISSNWNLSKIFVKFI